MPWRANPNRDALARLRALADEVGYTIEPAMMRERWRLTNVKTGKQALNERGSTAFTIKAAIKFLTGLTAPRQRRAAAEDC